MRLSITPFTFRRLHSALTILLIVYICASGCGNGGARVSHEPPRRIVSLLPSATELLVAIGQERKLVGVTLNDSYPESIKALPKVGDQTIDFEKLVSLKPDLVVVDAGFNKDEQKLKSLGLAVYVLHCDRLAEIAPAMRELGSRLGVSAEADKAAEDFEKDLAAIAALGAQESVFVEVWNEPLMTAGGQTLLDDLLNQVGLHNIYSEESGYFQVNQEDLVARKPSLVLLPHEPPLGKATSKVLELSKSIDGWQPRVLEIDSDLLVRAGPRVLEGMRKLSAEIDRTGGAKIED